VAVSKVALRARESLAIIRVSWDVLVLETLLWPDEVRTADFPFLAEDTQVRTQELAAASSLIDAMTGDFEPSAYRDGYREALETMIEAKIAGGDVLQQPGVPAPGGTMANPADLGEILRASVEAAKRARQEAA
jgi:DNA end-binding protein Ku